MGGCGCCFLRASCCEEDEREREVVKREAVLEVSSFANEEGRNPASPSLFNRFNSFRMKELGDTGGECECVCECCSVGISSSGGGLGCSFFNSFGFSGCIDESKDPLDDKVEGVDGEDSSVGEEEVVAVVVLHVSVVVVGIVVLVAFVIIIVSSSL